MALLRAQTGGSQARLSARWRCRCGGTGDEGRGLYIPFVPPKIRQWDDCCRSIPLPDFLVRESDCARPLRPFPAPAGTKGITHTTFSESRVPRGEVSPLGFPLHFRGVGYPCCQIAAWIPRPENANNSTVLHPQSRGVVTARLEYIQQYLPDGNQGPYTIYLVSWFPCCRLPASAGWSCCRHRTFPLIGVWKSRFPSSYPTVYRK